MHSCVSSSSRAACILLCRYMITTSAIVSDIMRDSNRCTVHCSAPCPLKIVRTANHGPCGQEDKCARPTEKLYRTQYVIPTAVKSTTIRLDIENRPDRKPRSVWTRSNCARSTELSEPQPPTLWLDSHTRTPKSAELRQ